MCKMTDFGARWKRAIDLPDFGESKTYWVTSHKGEQRYTLAPPTGSLYYADLRTLIRPKYAVKVTARQI